MSVAESLKDKGNALFKKQKYGAAIEAYTEAICFDSKTSTLYTNRALCHMKLKSWDSVVYDCKKALDLDRNNFKGSYLLGLALCERENWEDGVKLLKEAQMQASKQPKGAAMWEEIETEMRRAMKRKWELEQKTRRQDLEELSAYAFPLLHEKEEEETRKALENVSFSAAEKEEAVDRIRKSFNRRRRLLHNLVESQLASRQEIPDHLCCAITMDIVREPVIAPSGVTYEKKWIEKHLEQNGPTDPISRQRLQREMLIPNLALRQCANAFLDANPWAFEADPSL